MADLSKAAEMALEAKADYDDGVWLLMPEELERFAALVADAEREACARVCDALAAQDKLSNYYGVAAKAIRERSNHD